MATKKELTKDEKIKAEEKRLNEIFKNLDKDKKAINQKLISNAAFMAVTLEYLQEQINKEGAVVKAINGNGFEVISEHPAQKSYNTMINRYTTVIKQLTDLADSDIAPEEKDELLEFIKG